MKPLSMPCRQPGCGQLLAAHGYCARHKRPSCHATYDQTTRKDNPALALAARIRSGATWQKVRRIHRINSPLCCDPFNEHPYEPRANQNSHHIVPLAERPDLAYDLANLAALCTACHSRIEHLERAGQATRHLFAGKCANASQEAKIA